MDKKYGSITVPYQIFRHFYKISKKGGFMEYTKQPAGIMIPKAMEFDLDANTGLRTILPLGTM